MALTPLYDDSEPTWAGISSTIDKFSARFWIVDFPTPAFATAITGRTGNSFTVNAISWKKNDYLGVAWMCRDYRHTGAGGERVRINHPKFRYQPSYNFTGVIWTFTLQLSANARDYNSYDEGTPTIMLTHGDGTTSYINLKRNYDVLSSVTINGTKDYTWVLNFDTVVREKVAAPYYETLGALKESIIQVQFGFVPTDYDGTITTLRTEQMELSMTVSEISVNTSTHSQIKRNNTGETAHTVFMTDGFDDSYFMTPEQVAKSCYELGYRNWYNLYIGMSHYANLVKSGDYTIITDSGTVLNTPTSAWLTELAYWLNTYSIKLITSISFEYLENYVDKASADWVQKDYAGNPALTGWSPASTLLQPNATKVQTFLKKAFDEAMDCYPAGVPKYFQLGETWWWVTTKVYCHNFTFCRSLYYTETGGYIPDADLTDLSTSNATWLAVGAWLRDKLGVATKSIVDDVKANHATATSILLFYNPQVNLGTFVRLINRPTEWKYDSGNFDMFQAEDYEYATAADDYTQNGKTRAELLDETIADSITGGYFNYPIANVQYFGGFVLLMVKSTTVVSGANWDFFTGTASGMTTTGMSYYLTEGGTITNKVTVNGIEYCQINFGSNLGWKADNLAGLFVTVNGMSVRIMKNDLDGSGNSRLLTNDAFYPNQTGQTAALYLPEVDETLWNRVFNAMDNAETNGILSYGLWARPQVFRDGVLFENDPVLIPYKLVITTQPTAPATNGGALAVQPILEVQDINGNKITDSTASIVAAAGQATWTLGGTKTKSAVAGVGTFTNLTATVVTGDEPAEGEGVLQFRAYRNYETTEFFNKIYYYITGVFKKTYTARTRVSPNVVKYKFSNVDNKQHLVRELKVHELVINLKSRLRRITKI